MAKESELGPELRVTPASAICEVLLQVTDHGLDENVVYLREDSFKTG